MSEAAAQKLTWKAKWKILCLAFSVALRGWKTLEKVLNASAKPIEGIPVGTHSSVAEVFSTLLQDKTWQQVEEMALRADKFLDSEDLLVRVVRNHGRVAQDDVALGLEASKLVGGRVAEELVAFLGSARGRAATKLLELWLAGKLLPRAIQPGDGGYDAPAGAEGFGGISTGA